MPLPIPFRPLTGAVVAVSVVTGFAAGVVAGGLLLLTASMVRRA